MMFRQETFQLLTYGPAALPHSPGLVGVCVRYVDARAATPSLLSLRVVDDVNEAVRTMISERALDTLLRQRGPAELINIITRATPTVGEAQVILDRVWPAPPMQTLKAGLVSLAKDLLAEEVRRQRQRTRLAEIGVQMDLLRVRQQLDALRKRHARR